VTPKGPLGVVTEVRTRGQGALAGVFASVTAAKRARPRTAVDRLGRKHIAAMPSVERVRIDVAAVTFDRARTRIEYAPGVV
jgi:Holliday junction resolvase-like predicted endonuclease